MKKKHRITLRLDDEELQKLHFLSEKAERTTSELLRILLHHTADKNGYSENVCTTPKKVRTLKSKRINLAFSAEEWAKLEEGREKHLFTTMTAYLLSVLRNGSYGVSYLPAAELVELGKIRTNLHRIGSNVYQLSRRVIEDWREGTPELLKEVRNDLKDVIAMREELQSNILRAMNRHFQD